MKYDYFLNESLEFKKDGETKTVKVDQDILDKAYSRLLSFRRKRYKDTKSSDAFIIQEYVTEEDFITSIESVCNLKVGNIKEKEVKFDDVRNMSLRLDNLEGYTEAEKSFVQQRLSVYKSFYFGDSLLVAPNDEFQILDLIDMELDIMQLKTFVKLNKKSKEEEEKLKQMRLQYSKALQDLNVKKQQRDNRKKTETGDDELLKAINEADRTISEFEIEVVSEEEEEKQQMKAKKKRDKN